MFTSAFRRRGFAPALALSLSLLSLSQELVAQAAEAVLQDGTPVRLRLSRNLSSADAKEGETVDFEVLEEVRLGIRSSSRKAPSRSPP